MNGESNFKLPKICYHVSQKDNLIETVGLSEGDTLLFSVCENMFFFSLLFTGTSDPAMKEFLLHLDETMALGKKFILKDLDETHLFILAEVVQTLQERVGELMDQNSFPITQK